MSCTETNGETNHHHCTSGSPARGVQMSEANLGSNNLSIISAACVATSVQQKEILITYIITSADRQTRGALPHAPIPVLDPTLYTESTRPGLVGSCCRAPQPHNHTHHPILHNQQLLRQSGTQKLMEEDQTSAMSRVCHVSGLHRVGTAIPAPAGWRTDLP